VTVVTVWTCYLHSQWMRVQRYRPFFRPIRRWGHEWEPRLELESMSGFLLRLCCHVSSRGVEIGQSPALGELQFDISGCRPDVVN